MTVKEKPVRKPKPATYQDVLDAPPDKVAEMVGGVLYTHPRPAMPHTLAASSLQGTLHGPFRLGRGGPGGWWIVIEPELHLGPEVLVPDLAGWRRQRMPEYPDTSYCTLAPDWVCEVLSPATRHLDLGDKQQCYATENIPHLWLIDPIPRTLETYELRASRWHRLATASDNDPVSLPPFEALTFSLSDLWPDGGL